jgi:hypothetical protein
MFSELYQKTNKTEDTNKLTFLAFKIIIILHNTRLATFIKLLETVSKGLFSNRSQNSCRKADGNPRTCDSCSAKEALADSFQKFYECCQPCVAKDDDYFEGQ